MTQVRITKKKTLDNKKLVRSKNLVLNKLLNSVEVIHLMVELRSMVASIIETWRRCSWTFQNVSVVLGMPAAFDLGLSSFWDAGIYRGSSLDLNRHNVTGEVWL